jgi:hypothetical protein
MKSTYSALALASVLLVAVPLMADDLKKNDEKKGTNQAPPEVASKAKPSADADAVKQLHLAHSLIEYGRKNKAPEALITAARILAAQGTSEMKEKPTHEKAADAPKADKKDKAASDNSPKALLEEAKKLSKDNPAVVALANSVELSRGAVGGPKRNVDVVAALATDQYKIAFRGGEIARVAVSGDGDTRLDLYIYDENGNLVTSQVGPGDDCLASWVPRWTGVFVIRVVNRGLLSNRYLILTN